jgi:hypothetical protein
VQGLERHWRLHIREQCKKYTGKPRRHQKEKGTLPTAQKTNSRDVVGMPAKKFIRVYGKRHTTITNALLSECNLTRKQPQACKNVDKNIPAIGLKCKRFMTKSKAGLKK